MIGVDISDHSIKVMHLSNDSPQKYIAHSASDVPDGAITKGVVVAPDTVRKVLRDTLLRCKVNLKTKDTFVFSIPETQTFLRVIEVPEMQEDEVSEAIHWEVAQHIPLGLENMYIDWQPITYGSHETAKGKKEIQVGAAQRKLVDALYTMLAPLEFDIAAFELESQAIVRALITPELRDKQGIVMVDLGGTATNVIVHDHGALRFTATLEKGLDTMLGTLSQDDMRMLREGMETLDKKQQEYLAPKLAALTDELASEVLSIVEFYGSIDSQHVVHEIILTGGGSNIPGLDSAFLKHFDDIHVQRGNPWVNVLGSRGSSRAPLDVKESVRFSTALGLALRPVIR